MRKLIISVCLAAICICSAYSQKWNNYLQLSVGTGYLMDELDPLLRFEYGKSYKWLDIAAALEYANIYNHNTNRNTLYNSLILNVKIDIIRIFTESRHSFKLGTGAGVGAAIPQWHKVSDDYPDSGIFSLYSVTANYEYRITDKIWLGAFFNNNISNGFLGLCHLGLNIRRNF